MFYLCVLVEIITRFKVSLKKSHDSSCSDQFGGYMEFVFSSPYNISLLFQITQPSTKSNKELKAVFGYTTILQFSHIASSKTSFQMIRLEAFLIGMVTFIWIRTKLGCPSKHQANLYLMTTSTILLLLVNCLAQANLLINQSPSARRFVSCC